MAALRGLGGGLGILRGKRGALLTGTALCTATFLALSPIASVAQSYSFSSVKIEGNTLVDPATILKVAGIPKGQPVDAGQLNDAVQRLNASGMFASVDVVPQGGTLLIKVVENKTINAVAFEGNNRVKDEELAKIVKSQTRRVYTPAQAEADAAMITDLYTARGRMAARVEPKVIDRGNNKVDLVFEIREGRVTEVERLSFVGNRDFSDRRLRQVLQTKQAGILRQIIQRDTYVPDRTAVDKQLLLDFYHSRGYIDAQVLDVSSEFSRERNASFLTFNVHEGLSYSIANTSIVSEYPGIDTAEFQRALRIRPGTTYSPTAIDTTITRMESIAVKKGFEFVAIEPRITKNPKNQTLDVAFVITKGPRVFVERIDIEGNATTLDKVIRRQFRTVEGDPFSPREIRQAAERIRALDFFKTADVNARQGSAEDRVIVDVNVEEKPTGSLTFGASYSVSDGIGFNVGLSESNFLGRGQFLGVRISTTSDNQDSGITFIEPNLLDRDLKFKFASWYNTTDNSNSAYSTKRFGISPSLEFPIAERTRLELRYKLSSDKIYKVPTTSSTILQAEAARGSEITSALGYTVSYDTRLSPIDPRSKLKLTFGQDFAGVGGDVEAITTNATASYETKVFHDDVTLRAEIEGGAVAMRGGMDSRIVDRFTGNGKVRGFESNGYGPRDLAAANRDALGGNFYWAARVEGQFPLGLPEEYGVSGGVFADVGSVWGLNNAGTVDDSMHLRSSVGVSLFWDSGLGPLRFNFSKALKKESYDKEQSFDFTISTQF